jgi:hypothetical protein
MKKILLFILATGIASAAPINSKQIRKKLNNTIVAEAGPLNSFSIDEIIDILPKVSNNGLNFFYFPPRVVQQPATNNVQRPFINPATGLPPVGGQVNGFPPQFPPPNQLVRNKPKIVGLTRPIKNITLKQLLDVVTMSFDRPMIYVVTSFGVVFMESDEKGPQIVTRKMQLSPWAYRHLGIRNQ